MNPKDAKDNFVDLSSNRKASLRSNSLIDISSSSKGAWSFRLYKVKKVAKVITSRNKDDDFVSPPNLGQVNAKMAEITYMNHSGLIYTIYKSLSDNQKVALNEIRF